MASQKNKGVPITERITRYIGKIEPIGEGQRNGKLYDIGILLRKNFGLIADALASALSAVNSTKCFPPLSDNEVRTIAQSVDRADTPIGETTESYSADDRKTQQRTEYYVSAIAEPVPVDFLLQKEVCIYSDCKATTPKNTSTIGKILDMFRTGENARAQIDALRSEPDKAKQETLKKQIPAVVFGSEPQPKRADAFCKANGIICLDFDAIPSEELKSAKETIAAVDYIFAVGLSVREKGYFALAAYVGEPKLKVLLEAMQDDFPYTIDKSCSNVGRLRFVTRDENLVVKDTVYPAILNTKTAQGLKATQTKAVAMTAPCQCGIVPLDAILSKIEPVEWDGNSDKGYILRTIDRILSTAASIGHPMVNHEGTIYYWTETHYAPLADKNVRNFLKAAASLCGVPHDVSRFLYFVEKVQKQFLLDTESNGNVQEPNITYINLKNGTLFFDRRGHRFEPHSSTQFIRYVLNFDYAPQATAPLWQRHLERSLPILKKQHYLAECLALPFYQGKIEKAPVFYGQRDTGKSTTLDVYKELIGNENISTESLGALTKSDYHGDYARARLDGKLVNIAADVSKRINDEGMAKTLISREAVSARNPNQRGFDMRNYARLVFAMNELPPQFFTDPALTKRAAIIEFDRQVLAHEKDTDFAEKIIATELSGVLNWLVDGLGRLIAKGRLDPPTCCLEAMERIRKEVDPLSGWLEEREYYRGEADRITLKEAYADFKKYCEENGNQAPANKTFATRLRNLGYRVEVPNGHIGTCFFYQKSMPNFHSPDSPDSPSRENRGETGESAGNELGNESADRSPFPVHSPIIPHSGPEKTGAGNEGNQGNEKIEQSFDGETAPNPALPTAPKNVYRASELTPDPDAEANHDDELDAKSESIRHPQPRELF